MRRRSLKGAESPIARALDVIGDWWTLLMVSETSCCYMMIVI
jgi:DNA-binding HxlR family transcriptional regulator